MTTIYVTKWVFYRGILKVKGQLSDNPHLHKPHYWIGHLHPADASRRITMVTLGTDAFLTLDEALEDAQKRFVNAQALARTMLEKAREGERRLAAGQIEVHDLTTPPNPRLSTLQAFSAPV